MSETNILPKLKIPKFDVYEYAKNSTYERQINKLPEEVVFCKKCVVSNQRPRLIFNNDGVCNACKWAEEKNKIDWSIRKKEFEDMLKKYRKNNGEYDVIVPCSGGKDSGMIAHRLKYDYNMNPLIVCWSPLLYTDVGFQNLQNLFSSGISGNIYTPNRKIQRIISKMGLILIGNHFEAFGRGQMSCPINVAVEQNIKLVMYGENGELEYGGTHKNKDQSGQPFQDFVELYHKGSSTDEIVNFCLENGLLNKEEAKDESLKYYKLPDLDILKSKDIDFKWFGFYHKWNPQENFYYCAENFDFQANPEGQSEGTYSKYASLDDATDPLHYTMSYIKFGIGRATSDAAHEIRDNHLSREEGQALVKRYDHIFPERSMQITLDYLDLSKEELESIFNAYREKRPQIWKFDNVSASWKLKRAVYDK